MSVRIAVGVWVACGLLLPASLPAQAGDVEATGESDASRERTLEERIEELEKAREADAEEARERERLQRRIEELEVTQAANEEATRSIIGGALTGLATRINEFVDFGGVIEVEPGWAEDFPEVNPATGTVGSQTDRRAIELRTAELKFEVQVTDWARSSLVIEYDAGGDLLFTTTEDDEFAIDRINVDTGIITIGNPERFWPYLSFGRMVIPFGISTGDPVADVLSITDPLTVAIFETKKDALLIGFEFPTPKPRPEVLRAAPEPVRPQVIAPLVGRLARLLGYQPTPPPPPIPILTPVPPEAPPFWVGAYFYDGDTAEKFSREGEWDLAHHLGAMAGYRTKGKCRARLGGDRGAEELGWLHVFCPWTLDVGVEWNRSVFESDFLSLEYRAFIAGDALTGRNPIPFVPGMAASAKTTFGPFSLVAEWNGALESARFVDDAFNTVKIRPRAWQVALAYQFDWKPWVEAVGAQGTYVTAGYSASRDVSGVVRFNPNEGTLARIGSVPRRLIFVGAGEWVLPNLRLAIEWDRAWDYSKGHGGTNKVADGILARVTYEW